MTTKKRTKLAEAEARVAKQWPGLSKHRALSSFPKRALEKGAAVESEHVGGNKPLARRIAADHLVEDLKYYDKLAKQEAKMKKQKSRSRSAGRSTGDTRRAVLPAGTVLYHATKRPLRKLAPKPMWFGVHAGEIGGYGSHLYKMTLQRDVELYPMSDFEGAAGELGIKRSKKEVTRSFAPHLAARGLDGYWYRNTHYAEHQDVMLLRPDLVLSAPQAVEAGHAAGRAKGDPTDLNLSALDRELRGHEARGDATLHRFSPTSMNAMRRLLKAGYLAPAVGQPGHWVLTGQGEMALEGFRQREAATAARWAKPGHAAGEAVVIPEDPRVECFTKAISGALKKLAARIEPKGFRLHDISYGTTLYNQGRGVIAGVPGARVSFQAVGPRGARVHFHGSFRYDREDYLVGTLTVSGAESKREWSLTRGKCVEVAKLIAAPSTFPRHEMKLAGLSGAGMASGRSRVVSVEKVYGMLEDLRRSGLSLGKKRGESVMRFELDARHHAVISHGFDAWTADVYRADALTGEGLIEDELKGPPLSAPSNEVARWVRSLKPTTTVY